MAFRVLRVLKARQHIVDSGFVHGTTLAITPMGFAKVLIPCALSSLIMPQVFIPR